ncbi:HAD-like domain-containing protein [Lipomyces oligophaga]|uniref:HAD-like domain-containing protein n=1 Tax=Lipomyces oligophaga TaxID=45792 RepID=UPI0034CEC700
MSEIKALFFDVFGTVVDWRTGVKEHLIKNLPSDKADLKDSVDWDTLVQDWRTAYFKFTVANSKSDASAPVFVTIDQQYTASIGPILKEYGIDSVWDDGQHEELARAWHYLGGWPDSVEGLTKLKSKYIISTLSNGNVRLLVDMAKYAGLPWDVVFGGDVFKIYKPSPKVYLGAAELLNLKPENVLMVAAHFYDLEAAKKYGLQTAYVVRQGEDTGITVTPDQVDYFAQNFFDLYDQLTK